MIRIARFAVVAALAFAVSANAAEPTTAKEGTPESAKSGTSVKTPPKAAMKAGAKARKGAPGDTLFRPIGSRPERKYVKVTGEVIDVFCYLDRGFTGEVHRWCALSCIAGGMPMGLLAEDGTIWLLCMDHGYAMDRHIVTYQRPYENLKQWAAYMVQVEGYVIQRKGMKGIEIRDAKLLQEFLPPRDAPPADSLLPEVSP